MHVLARWVTRPPLPDPLPGEDREFGSGLFVDLVPSGCWFTNVRSCVEKPDWGRLRQLVIGRPGRRCKACGAPPDRERKLWMECHERWFFDERAYVQHLRRLVCLCTACHESTHFGLAQVRGRSQPAREQLMRGTGMSEPQARKHVADAFSVWDARCRHDWSLDLTVLTNAGITVTPPKGSRRGSAALELERARARNRR